MPQKTLVFTGSLFSIPLINRLVQENRCAGIIIPDYLRKDLVRLEFFAQQHQLLYLLANKNELQTTIREWMQEQAPEVVFMLNFPYKIPHELIEIPPIGFFNFHFGLLPQYRGAEPVFWTLKNREKAGAITVHQIDTEWDTGDILYTQEVPVSSEDTYGLYLNRLSFVAVQVLNKVLTLLGNKPTTTLHTQESSIAHYHPKPKEDDLLINWKTQDSDEIQALVNACNPKYKGALTYYQDASFRILEVMPAQATGAPIACPGTIVHADSQQGVFVLCKDFKLLRINIVMTDQGIFSTFKLTSIGIKAGEQFRERPKILQKEVALAANS